MFRRVRLPQSRHLVAHLDMIKRRGAVAASVAVLVALIALPVSAAPTQKTYTPTAAPSCIATSATSTNFTYTLKNTMPPGGQTFASANITVPAGFNVPSASSAYTFTFANPSTSKNWTAAVVGTTTKTIQLRSAASTDAIPPQGSVILHFTVGAQSAGTYQWNTVVKQSNDFRGTNNTFSLTTGASQPTTTVGTCNASPTANAVSKTTDEDTATNITLSGSDAESCELTFSIVSNPSHGTLGSITNNACTTGPNADTASVQYTPTANYNGSDSFTYKVNDGTSDSAAATVSITITAVEDAPTADAKTASTDEDTATSISLSGSDPETCNLTFSIVSGPSNGSLGSITDNACTAGSPNTDTASVQYTPGSNFNGSDSFTYKVTDGSSTDSAPATVSITVNALNDAPTADGKSPSTDEDTPVTVTLTGSDVETCQLTFTIVTGPSNGSLGAISDNACTAGNPNSDSATVQYTPDADYFGSDSFTYKVNDGTADSSTATVNLTVNSVNDAPVAADDSYTAVTDQTLTVAAPGVVGNDTDADGDPLSAVLDTDGAHGTVTLNADGSFTYVPNTGFSGDDSFTYHANDGTADSNVATVTITVWASSLGCGQSTTTGGEGTQATITNLDGEGCDPIVFTSTFDGDEFNIDKPAGEHVHLRIDLNAWNPEAAINPIPATQVSPPVPAEDGVWCNGDPVTFSMPDGHTWCLIQQSAQLAGTSGGTQQMQVYESWLLDGDATLCRTCK